MNRMSTNKLLPGMQLSRPVLSENGDKLLESNIVLSTALISLLKKKGIQFVYTENEKVDRNEILRAIRNVLSGLSQHKHYINDIISDSISWNVYRKLLVKLLSELEQDDVLQNILIDIVANDTYVFTHSLNVGIYSIAIAQELRLNKQLLLPLFKAALLHDVGKIFISKNIINKNSRLTDEEYRQIQRHSEYGFNYLKQNGISSQSILLPVLQHHERLDGTGYPNRSKDNEIHLFSKIIAVADVFDALSTDRSYRKALTPHESLLILTKDSGTKFDPIIVRAFSNAIIFYPRGHYVELSTGAVGYIKHYHADSIENPIVQIREIEYDLQQLDVSIVYAKPLLRYSFGIKKSA